MRRQVKKKTIWQRVDIKGKVLIVSLSLGAIVAAGGALGVSQRAYHEIKPWAGQETESVVAGLQSDKLWTRLQYVERRIEKLELLSKIQEDGLTIKQQQELDYWREEKRQFEFILQQIQQQQRPYVGK